MFSNHGSIPCHGTALKRLEQGEHIPWSGYVWASPKEVPTYHVGVAQGIKPPTYHVGVTQGSQAPTYHEGDDPRK